MADLVGRGGARMDAQPGGTPHTMLDDTAGDSKTGKVAGNEAAGFPDEKRPTRGYGSGHGEESPVKIDELDPVARRQAKRKLDAFLLTTLTLAYFLSFLDRANIGNARAAGLQTDLGLTNRQYSIVLTVTYVPYIAAELPLTLAMRAVGPHRLLPALVVSWGLVTTLQGLVTSYGGLLAARFFLGLCEGAILPGSITYLSTFYTRADMGKRIAFYFSATSLAGAFSGLLAAGLIQMEGLQGRRGWSWLFIIEGLFTVVCGFGMFFILFPNIQGTRYLSAEQKRALEIALIQDGHTAEESAPFSWSTVAQALVTPQVWFMCLQFFASGTMLFSLAYFAPSIVQALGYRGTAIQLYSVPPYACSAAYAITINILSDRLRMRGPFVIASACISVTGYGLFLGSRNTNVLYAALFLQVIGTYSLASLQSVWMPNNVAPYYKRSTAIVMGFVFTNCGGILSTWLFPTTEAPRFRRGTSVLLGLSCSIVVTAALNTLYLMWQNKLKRKAVEEGRLGRFEGATGDRQVGFVYIP